MDDHKESVLVIGATGQQGGAVARALLGRGRTVHALVRDPDRPGARQLQAAGARLVTGDLDDLASMRTAMGDVGGVFLMLTSVTSGTVTLQDVEAEVRRGKAVADLAAEAGVEHFVYSSVAGADQDTGIPHLESKGHIEAHIRGLGLPATVLRPVFFMENFTTVTRPVLTEGGLDSGVFPPDPDRAVACLRRKGREDVRLVRFRRDGTPRPAGPARPVPEGHDAGGVAALDRLAPVVDGHRRRSGKGTTERLRRRRLPPGGCAREVTAPRGRLIRPARR